MFKVGDEVFLEVTGCELAWFQATSYACVKSCASVQKRLNGEIYQQKVSDKDVRETDSLEWLLQPDTGWTKNVGAVGIGVEKAWGDLKAELTRT